MRCPFCDGKFTLQGPFCPLCGRRIIGREPDSSRTGCQPQQDLAPRPTRANPAAAASPVPGGDDVLVVEVEDVPAPRPRPGPAVTPQRPTGLAGGAAYTASPVSGEYVGRLCPYCRFPLKTRERMVICPACRVAHHADCWQENGGCTTYGCGYAPEAHPPQPAPLATAGAGSGESLRPSLPRGIPSPAAATAAAGLEATATNGFVLAILGLFSFGLLGLIGAIVGAGVLVRMRALGIRMQSARGKAVGAIILGLGTIGFWILVMLVSMSSPGGF